jgi:hypothetical protein
MMATQLLMILETLDSKQKHLTETGNPNIDKA